MKKILSNAFSINMIGGMEEAVVHFRKITPEAIPVNAESQIGHADMAAILTGILGRPIKVNRGNCQLELCDELYVAQYIGPRLPEGATKLPEGATIKFFLVTLE